MSLRRRLSPALAVAAAAALAGSLLPGSAAAAPPETSGVHLALGDSVPAGSETGGYSYVDVLAGRVASGRLPLTTEDLSEGGETTGSLMQEQLPPALASIIDARETDDPSDDVRLITLTIGGNDVFGPVTSACILGLNPGCATAVSSGLTSFATNYAQILATLRQAAGLDTTIAVMTYYNSVVPPCPVAALGALAEQVLEGGELVTLGLNDIIRATAAAYGAVVVETEQVIGPEQLVGDCLHPTVAGQKAIANQFWSKVARAVRTP